eukprot:5619802-Pyramimonas_sp.AAC.1
MWEKGMCSPVSKGSIEGNECRSRVPLALQPIGVVQLARARERRPGNAKRQNVMDSAEGIEKKKYCKLGFSLCFEKWGGWLQDIGAKVEQWLP